MKRSLICIFIAFYAAAATSGNSLEGAVDLKLNDDLKATLAFACVHEKIPESSADLELTFRYARWLQRGNALHRDKAIYEKAERLYRIAAENGHYKANINLQNGSMRSQFKLSREERLRYSQELIDAGIATGYYFVGVYLLRGAAGLQEDPDMALRYIRNAADMGNPQAQHFIAEKLAPIDIAPTIATQMYRCAAEQGHGDAATTLGFWLKDTAPDQAVQAFQLGVAAGDETSAGMLSDGFRNPPPSDVLHYMGLEEDLERADRYHVIWKVLARASYARPTVPEINEIVPLPPAKLPPWDGTIEWVKDRRANIPPPKPSDELLKKLTDEKSLEFDTGKPKPGHPAFSRIQFPTQLCTSGEPCPETGYWRTDVAYIIWGGEAQGTEFIQRFEKGDVMPTKMVEYLYIRNWPRRDKVEFKEESVKWTLIG